MFIISLGAEITVVFVFIVGLMFFDRNYHKKLRIRRRP